LLLQLKLELLLLLLRLLFRLGGRPRLLGDRPTLMLLLVSRMLLVCLCLYLMLLLCLCGAQAPSMQEPGVISRVGLKVMRILLYLCNAIYIAYVSIVCDASRLLCVSVACECGLETRQRHRQLQMRIRKAWGGV